MAKLSTQHRNLLYLVQIQPLSTYGVELQRRLGLTLLHWLVLKFVKQEQRGKRFDDERCNVTVPDKVEVNCSLVLCTHDLSFVIGCLCSHGFKVSESKYQKVIP